MFSAVLSAMLSAILAGLPRMKLLIWRAFSGIFVPQNARHCLCLVIQSQPESMQKRIQSIDLA
jgi:hypothetical protein